MRAPTPRAPSPPPRPLRFVDPSAPSHRFASVVSSSDFAIIATEGFWRGMNYGGARITLLEHFAAGGLKADASFVLKTEALVQSSAKGESNHDIAIAVLFF